MKQFLKFLLILLPMLGCGNIYARLQGQPYIDSLLKELPKQKEDTNKVNLLNSLSYAYRYTNPDEGIKYGQQGLELATKLEWKKGIAGTNGCLGTNYIYKSDYPKALAYYFKALKLCEEFGNKKGTANVISNIGLVYQNQSDYPKALEYFFKALMLLEEIGNKQGIAGVTDNIGIVYYSQKDYPKALEYYFKALKLDEEIGDKGSIAGVTGNIGSVYQYQKDYPKALEYDFKALKLFEEIGNKGGIASTKGNIGNVYIEQHNYTEGIAYQFKALKMYEEMGDKDAAAKNLENIGSSYISIVTHPGGQADTNKANAIDNSMEARRGVYVPDSLIPRSRSALLHKSVDYLQKAIAINKEIGDLDNLQNNYGNLSTADSLLGDYRGSLTDYKLHTVYKDSVFNEAKKTEIMRLGMVRKMDVDSLKSAQQREVVELKYRQQRSYTYLGIAGMLLLVGFSVFIVKERGKSEKERKKSDELLLNILPAEVARELKANGSAEARHFDNVTVLFTDFVNFTNAGERMTAKGLVDELHNCFKAFDEITAKYRIEKIKTIGDAYLAVCGLPSPDPKHAENIVRAAIEINHFMQDRLAKLGNRTFDVRIGIHSGSVVAGIVGSKKFAYDIWGDTVNTAARMEQNSEPGKINISQTTYELVKDKFDCAYRGEIEAKNKGMMKMYYIT